MVNRKDSNVVMQRAWTLHRETKKSFAICLSKAWALYRLVKKMRQGVAVFAFEKADGSLRRARGTLKNTGQFVKGTGVSTPDKTVRYYDIDKSSFRSFKIENFITMY